MGLQNEEQDELVELVEEQSDAIKEILVSQNTLISLLIAKGLITNEEFTSATAQISEALNSSEQSKLCIKKPSPEGT